MIIRYKLQEIVKNRLKRWHTIGEMVWYNVLITTAYKEELKVGNWLEKRSDEMKVDLSFTSSSVFEI